MAPLRGEKIKTDRALIFKRLAQTPWPKASFASTGIKALSSVLAL